MINSIFKEWSLLFGLIILLVLPNLSEGQVKYDTTLFTKEPCTVKKVTMRYDTNNLPVKGDDTFYRRDRCSFELKWPIFRNCGDFHDSTLNSLENEELIRKINIKHPRKYCLYSRNSAKGNFKIKRFDDSFLSFCFKIEYYTTSGTSPERSVFINYDFQKEAFISLWELFKQEYDKDTIKKSIREMIDLDDEFELVIGPKRFLNLKDKIVLYGVPSLSPFEKITIQKENFKKYLNEEYL